MNIYMCVLATRKYHFKVVEILCMGVLGTYQKHRKAFKIILEKMNNYESWEMMCERSKNDEKCKSGRLKRHIERILV